MKLKNFKVTGRKERIKGEKDTKKQQMNVMFYAISVFLFQWVPRALSLGVKRQGRETDHSPTSSDVKET
jgi:hypothetical protein